MNSQEPRAPSHQRRADDVSHLFRADQLAIRVSRLEGDSCPLQSMYKIFANFAMIIRVCYAQALLLVIYCISLVPAIIAPRRPRTHRSTNSSPRNAGNPKLDLSDQFKHCILQKENTHLGRKPLAQMISLIIIYPFSRARICTQF